MERYLGVLGVCRNVGQPWIAKETTVGRVYAVIALLALAGNVWGALTPRLPTLSYPVLTEDRVERWTPFRSGQIGFPSG